MRGWPLEMMAACGVVLVASGPMSGAWAAPDASTPIEATTAEGERVRLHPNGRWEYVDAKKAEAQRPAIERFEQERDKEKALEQGGLLGIGRKIKPGDPDYNRGSLGGKSK